MGQFCIVLHRSGWIRDRSGQQLRSRITRTFNTHAGLRSIKIKVCIKTRIIDPDCSSYSNATAVS
jgi:hypothetical protein